MAKKRVLVIEDNEEISEVVGWILEEEGYEISVTAHLPVAEIVALKADLIVLDEWINDREGHMLCREIKNLEELKHVPVVIFSTALDIESIVETCGAAGYVRKPFDIDALTGEVNRLLSPKKLNAASF
jgi:DNA-binding response OmpR family regulator